MIVYVCDHETPNRSYYINRKQWNCSTTTAGDDKMRSNLGMYFLHQVCTAVQDIQTSGEKKNKSVTKWLKQPTHCKHHSLTTDHMTNPLH